MNTKGIRCINQEIFCDIVMRSKSLKGAACIHVNMTKEMCRSVGRYPMLERYLMQDWMKIMYSIVIETSIQQQKKL